MRETLDEIKGHLKRGQLDAVAWTILAWPLNVRLFMRHVLEERKSRTYWWGMFLWFGSELCCFWREWRTEAFRYQLRIVINALYNFVFLEAA